MSQFVATPKRPRATAMGITLAVHLAMLAALLAVSSDPIARIREPAVVVTLPGLEADTDGEAASDGGEEPAPAPDPAPATESPYEGMPPPPPMPTTMPLDIPLPPPLPSGLATIDFGTPVFDAEPDPATTGDVAATIPSGVGVGSGNAGSGCPLVEALRIALERDPRALAALTSIPRGSRSVANAVQMWDGRWIAPSRVGGRATTDAVRAALAVVMNDASDACRTQINLGPVFVPVTEGRGTIFLAFGSGGWRWIDLLRSDPQSVEGPLPYQRVGQPN